MWRVIFLLFLAVGIYADDFMSEAPVEELKELSKADVVKMIEMEYTHDNNSDENDGK